MKERMLFIDTDVRGANRVWIAEVDISVESDQAIIYRKTFTGTAFRDPSDRPNDNVGAQLAIGRALESAGKRIQKIAWQNVQKPEIEKIDKKPAKKDKKKK